MDIAAQAVMYRCYGVETTACHGNEEERSMLRARDDHEDSSKRTVPLEWKVAEDNTERMMEAAVDDNEACPCAVEFLLLCPSAKMTACKNTGSMRSCQGLVTSNKGYYIPQAQMSGLLRP